jgi:hypothetical protein
MAPRFSYKSSIVLAHLVGELRCTSVVMRYDVGQTKTETPINFGLFSTTMSWFLHPEGVAKKNDELDSLVPDPTNPNVMVSNKR